LEGVWVLPRRLLPSRRARWDRRHTRVGPGRPRDRVAGARGTSRASISELRENLVGHGVIGLERGLQTLASARCADWLRRAARAALLVIAFRLSLLPALLFRAVFPPMGRGSSTALGWPSKSSIAAGCFAAGSFGCRRRVIARGSWRAITSSRIREAPPQSASPVRLARRRKPRSLGWGSCSRSRRRIGPSAIGSFRSYP
jgi:hypothetical protein